MASNFFEDLLLTLLLIRQEIVHWFGENFNWYFVAHCDDTERTCIVTVWSHSLTIILQILTLIAALYIYGGISHWRLMSDGPLQLVVDEARRERDKRKQEVSGGELVVRYRSRSPSRADINYVWQCSWSSDEESEESQDNDDHNDDLSQDDSVQSEISDKDSEVSIQMDIDKSDEMELGGVCIQNNFEDEAYDNCDSIGQESLGSNLGPADHIKEINNNEESIQKVQGETQDVKDEIVHNKQRSCDSSDPSSADDKDENIYLTCPGSETNDKLETELSDNSTVVREKNSNDNIEIVFDIISDVICNSVWLVEGFRAVQNSVLLNSLTDVFETDSQSIVVSEEAPSKDLINDYVQNHSKSDFYYDSSYPSAVMVKESDSDHLSKLTNEIATNSVKNHVSSGKFYSEKDDTLQKENIQEQT